MVVLSKINKSFKLLFLITCSLFFSTILYSQEGFIINRDTLNAEEHGFFSIPEIDYEIEKINTFLNRTSKIIENLNHQLDTDTTYKTLFAKTEKEAYDFDSYLPEDLSKFFLENSSRIWAGYMVRLKAIQSNSFYLLTKSEERNKSLEKQEKTWQKTYENTKNNRIPKIQIDRIREVQERINTQHNNNYKISLRLITYETALTSQLAFITNKLEQIEYLQNVYRENLFTRSDSPIWKINLNDSTNRKLPASLKQAWYDNTKYIIGNYHAFTPSFNKFILFSFLLIALLFFIKKKYFRKFGDIRRAKKGDLTFVIIHNPIASTISTVLFVFFVVFENIPLALAQLVTLALLISVFFTLKIYFSKSGEIIIRKFIILLILNSFEIVIWYLGDYSRLFLLLEAGLGIWFTYSYISPYFTKQVLPSFRFNRLVKIVRYPIFILFIISFIANITGYVNLTIFLQKLAIQSTVIIVIVIGMWYIIRSFLQLAVDLLNRNEKLRLKVYLPLLTKRITQFFKLYFSFVLFKAFLNLFEIRTSFYKSTEEFFTISRKLGSLDFTFGDIFLFIFILLLSWGLNSIIKMIFDEDNYRKFETMRGIPSAISMTLRILFTSAAIFFAFSAAGFDMKSFSIVLGALSVGIGFGLQNVVNNYISGLILIYERPVQKGDIVEVNNLLGEVVDIGIRRSNVRTFDGAEVIIPNANLTSNDLINWTLSDKHKRLDLKIGVSYNSDPNLVLSILNEVATQNTLIVNFPPPKILFDEFGDSSLNYRVLCWVLLENSLQAKSNLSIEIFNAFAKKGIEIPFPQMDLHVKDVSEKPSLQKENEETLDKHSDHEGNIE